MHENQTLLSVKNKKYNINLSSAESAQSITKTYLYNFDPLKPHFYVVKLGFTGEAVLTSTHNLCFEQKYEKYQNCFTWKSSVFGGEIFYIFE